MKFIKRFILYLIILIAVLAGISFLLPGQAEVARSIRIDAPAEAVFPHVNSMQKTEAWSPWLSRDPETELTYSGPEEGVGNKLQWASDDPNVGAGTQEILVSEANNKVETALDFGDMGTAMAYFELVEADGGTDVTWGFTSDLGMNPMMRWMGLMMDRWVGADYERGLSNLKTLVENQS
ncbi:MAG: SRPBCC family protein [Pseudomonadota bacterium]